MRITLGPGAEFELIESFLRNVRPRSDVIVSAGDDCAVVEGPRLALSMDLSVEGIHFRRDWLSAEEIGYRCAAVALSDLAAMAAEPIGVLVSLGLTEDDMPDIAKRIMDGVNEACSAAGASLIGGDVTRSPRCLIVDVTVVGRVDTLVLRSGALPGDSLWVTGCLGAAAAAVGTASKGRTPGADAHAAYAHPVPRIAEARWLAEHVALHALIDISDGLAGDAAHIAAASGTGITIDESAVPIHAAVLRTRGGMSQHLACALSGGDDYELCFAAAAGSVERVSSEFERIHNVPLARVGTVDSEPGMRIRRPDGRVEALALHGYRHFDETKS